METVPQKLDQVLKIYGPYPLHKAALLGHKNNLKFLLDNGHSPNQTNYDCMTPLHEACLQNKVECAQILIEYGAKVNAHSADGGTPLCSACAAGNISCVELLMQMGAEVNPPLALSTPLHEACFRGSMDCMSVLIRAGARLNANDCHFGTPLHAATVMNRPHCVKLLLQAGALVNATKIHETALHIAARENLIEVVQVLLEFGANVFASNNQNKLPIDLIPEAHGVVFKLLVHYAAYPASLKDLSRRTVRSVLGSQRIRLLSSLDIPQSLLLYLMHKE
ncbi:hypothetical protein JTE90_009447 [Oedothorax gibbosus]|uniref:SOCS box domain-containing protein n=1 Tax=Oedothorax gibbosus TaxID=931172 RepID=A0AAV6VU64_9ARAC|nr:hypothetical protein JTE90_009447 [Oedothorax gibbosus]